MNREREGLVAQTFVQLADSLVEDFDIIDLLMMLADRCVELLDVQAAGILLSDEQDKLRVMAASSDAARLLELFQLQNDEGPCLEAYSTGQPVSHAQLSTADERWPSFAAEAVSAGFGSVYALPLRLRAVVIGALNLFRTADGAMPDADAQLAQALAHVASIAILQDQALRESAIRAGELQHALDSRVAIEQAKGMVAERAQISMNEAFRNLRAYARDHNRQLTDVALNLISGGIAIDEVAVVGAVTTWSSRHKTT